MIAMIFAINALFFGWVASFWSKTGALNLLIAAAFTVLALVNAALAAPVVMKWIAP